MSATPSPGERFDPMPMPQPDLFDTPPALPAGMVYADGFVTAAEEENLVGQIGELTFKPFEFRGVLARRQVIYFGLRYDFTRGVIEQAEPMPAWLIPLRDRCAAFAGLEPERLPQVLINAYAPGAGLGWHRDRPQFEDVVGVSLLAACPLRLRRRRADGRFERTTLIVEPRSIYLLRGPARWEWEHSIPPVAAQRYSVTFRSLRA